MVIKSKSRFEYYSYILEMLKVVRDNFKSLSPQEKNILVFIMAKYSELEGLDEADIISSIYSTENRDKLLNFTGLKNSQALANIKSSLKRKGFLVAPLYKLNPNCKIPYRKKMTFNFIFENEV